MFGIADRAPVDDRVTDYDRAQESLYRRLLEAADAGREWSDVAQTLMRLDPVRARDAARLAYETHLSRAAWMVEQGHFGR